MRSLIFDSKDFKDTSFKNSHVFYIQNEMECTISENYLEITFENDTNSVYRVYGENNIKLYSKGNRDVIKKFKITNTETPILLDNYDHPCLISNIVEQEEPSLEFNNELPRNHKIVKEFKYTSSKEKISYTTYVQNISERSGLTLKESNINNKIPSYVYKMNLPDNYSETDEDTLIKQMLFILEGNIMPMQKSEQKEVLIKYNRLIKMLFKDTVSINDDNIVIINPRPVTLEKINLLPADMLGALSIIENYAVTEKADGERFLMYIDDDSNCYLINNAKTVRGVNMKTTLKNTLIDGELVICQDRISESNKDLFAIFDIYIFNNENVAKLPLIGFDSNEKSRYTVMNKTKDLIQNCATHDITVKKQLVSEKQQSIYAQCDHILSNPMEFDYTIDGLIFTPTRLPVFSNYANKPVLLGVLNPKWDKVLKWKPPEQNTVDFIIMETDKNNITYSDGKRFKEFILQVGYRADTMEPITVIRGLQIMNGKSPEPSNVYALKEFIIDDTVQKAHIELIDNKCFANNGDEILHNSVVEFAYDNKTPIKSNERRWYPLRVRHDKNKIYNVGNGTISNAVNNRDIAMNVWRSITNPITQDMITGKESGTDNTLEDNIMGYMSSNEKYYNRINDKDPERLISNKMIAFHNHVIKRNLYVAPEIIQKIRKKQARPGNVSLLELACGQGSDIDRWVTSGYSTVLGIDYTLDNITNPESGIYSRYIRKSKYLREKKLNMVFVAGDCSKPIRNGACSDKIDNNSKDILRHLFVKPNRKFTDLGIHSKHFGDKFNVVSCMFSIHYFFESELLLDRFIQNVADFLLPGGEFITTFMDGDKVETQLNKHNGKYVGIDEESKATVWAIISQYKKNQRSIYNKKIDVFIENTGKLIPENIVNFNVLISKFAKHDIHLVQDEMFEATFKKALSNDKLHEKTKTSLQEFNKQEIMKNFSFLNRWAIFKKSNS